MTLKDGDTVLFSSKTIPGNEAAVYRLYNRLSENGVTVIDGDMEHIHACKAQMKAYFLYGANGFYYAGLPNMQVEGVQVDFDAVQEKAAAITPVPGGVGPMTITMLMKNTVHACKVHNKLV